MNGLEIVQRVLQRLRRPSQQALAYPLVLSAVSEVVARKRIDLTLSSQNSLATVSPWFTPTTTNFEMEGYGLAGILLPIRVERRAIDSEYETGDNVPIVNYEVLDTSINGAISFYGDPIRMAFRDTLDYVSNQQYRVIYESDFENDVLLTNPLGLPDYFRGMISLEAAWDLLEMVEDDSPEWAAYQNLAMKKWPIQVADHRRAWDRYVRHFRGKAQIPKRTFWQNNRGRLRTVFFRG